MVHARQKGYRSVQKAVDYYENEGWKVDKVEKTGKFVFEKDLYGLFDLLCIKQNLVLFVQVKSNRPATKKPYAEFMDMYGGSNVWVECYTWYDFSGPVVHRYYPLGIVEKIDMRKKKNG